ncbi:MAG TPA: fibronectin type III domain-containing protein [Methylomirabilota bacterium]|jgi:hypothetical protein
MSWLDELRRWLDSRESGAQGETPSPPPAFTVGPRPFGVGRDVAGVEWQTDKRTSGLVRYRAVGIEPWTEVVDDSRQRDHQRGLTRLTPDTEYQVEVTAKVPQRGGGAVTRTISIRTLPNGVTPDQPPREPPPDRPGGAPDDGEPLPHQPMTVNVLAERAVWLPGTLTQVDPAIASWLRRTCLGGATKLVLADMRQVPGRMRQAGFRGRDNALYYTLSRSYAEWNWHGDPHDPDAHLSDQRRELHDIWSNYIDVVVSVMSAAPQTTALILDNDGPDRCGKELGEYTQRQMSAVRNRVELGRFYQ